MKKNDIIAGIPSHNNQKTISFVAEQIGKTFEKRLAENEYSTQKTKTDTGPDAGNNGEDDMDDFDLVGLIKEKLPERRFREIMKENGLDPDAHMSG